MLNYQVIADTLGCDRCDIPTELKEIFGTLDRRIKDANQNNCGCRSDYGLRSTQLVGLVVMLWQMGLLRLTD